MLKPKLSSLVEGQIIVSLPRASEKYGPISHYYVIVVPNITYSSGHYPNTQDLLTYSRTISDDNYDTPIGKPYIAAKFSWQSVKTFFVLGNELNYGGFINHRLRRDTYYKVFVRAFVDNRQNNVYTSSPYSTELSINMSAPDSPQPQYSK